MNNRGFTLIELLVTILILSIVSVISYVSVTNVIKQGKINDCKSLVKNIKSATKEYFSDYRYNNNWDVTDDYILITGNTLVDNNYLSSPIINPIDKSEIEASTIQIEVILNDDYSAGNIKITYPSVFSNNCE